VLNDKSLPGNQQVDPSIPVRELHLAQWASIVRAFDNWPFAPDVCGISEMIVAEVLKVIHRLFLCTKCSRTPKGNDDQIIGLVFSIIWRLHIK
jgi:hypothetical protein